MIYRPESDNDSDDNLDAFYKRKQSAKHNQIKGEAEVLRDKDRDAEQHASNWKGEGQKPRWGKDSDLWENDPWNDKEQHKRD